MGLLDIFNMGFLIKPGSSWEEVKSEMKSDNNRPLTMSEIYDSYCRGDITYEDFEEIKKQYNKEKHELDMDSAEDK